MIQEPHPSTAPEVLEELRRLADLGEVAGPLTHEINNFLNVLMLNVALLEQTLPPEPCPELLHIRRHGTALAELVRQFQQNRQRPQIALAPLDLHAELRAVLAALAVVPTKPGPIPPIHIFNSRHSPWAGGCRRGDLDLAADLPPVLAIAPDVRRLLTFLLRNAVAAAARTNGQVKVRTRHAAGRVKIRIADTGELVEVDRLPKFFDPSSPAREGVNQLEMAACRAIARRLQGKLEAEPCLEAGVAVVAEFVTR